MNNQRSKFCFIPIAVLCVLNNHYRERDEKMIALRFYCIIRQANELHYNLSENSDKEFDEDMILAQQFNAFGVSCGIRKGSMGDDFADTSRCMFFERSKERAEAIFGSISKEMETMPMENIQAKVDIRVIAEGGIELGWEELSVYIAIQSIAASKNASPATIARREQIAIRAKGYPKRPYMPPEEKTMKVQNVSRVAKKLESLGLIFCNRVTDRETVYGSPLHSTEGKFRQRCEELKKKYLERRESKQASYG